jgi:hypothetical protein
VVKNVDAAGLRIARLAYVKKNVDAAGLRIARLAYVMHYSLG